MNTSPSFAIFLSLFVAVATILLSNSSQADEPAQLRVMSYNIRYGTANDGEDAWPNRKDPMIKFLASEKLDILGLQEALRYQIDELLEGLPEFKRSGVGRNDGKDSGEFSPVLYRHERFDAVREGTFWLSEKPDEAGSKGWDAQLPRVCSWIELKDRTTGEKLLAASTHFDHMGNQARVESGKLIVAKLKELAGSLPVVLVGDFNARLASAPIQNVLAKPDSTSDWALVDALAVSKSKPTGPTATFNSFKEIPEGDNKIDFIFVRGLDVLEHAVLDPRTPAKRFVSDHQPVRATIALPTAKAE